jgi:hypothetical protein
MATEYTLHFFDAYADCVADGTASDANVTETYHDLSTNSVTQYCLEESYDDDTPTEYSLFVLDDSCDHGHIEGFYFACTDCDDIANCDQSDGSTTSSSEFEEGDLAALNTFLAGGLCVQMDDGSALVYVLESGDAIEFPEDDCPEDDHDDHDHDDHDHDDDFDVASNLFIGLGSGVALFSVLL